MHKSEDYGKILLKQKDKQTTEPMKNFALKVAKQMPYPTEIILRAIEELTREGVIHIEGDFLAQKRMIYDNQLSLKRAKAGSKGGKFAQAKVKAKGQANTENEYESEDEDENKLNGVEIDFTQPDIEGDEVSFPLDTPPVRQLWAKWKESRYKNHKLRYKMMGEQAALKRLQGMTYQQIESTILAAISGGWANLYPEKNNGTKTGTTKSKQHAHDLITAHAERWGNDSPKKGL
ncbi:MAG TPA: hypothetical protein PKN99_11070 [Cyclobacteriaceae bacterium]|nr:hypothetical protein [Cyclobacteriaceae bacterium]